MMQTTFLELMKSLSPSGGSFLKTINYP